ncbi:hypothetical protein PSYPI_44531, partial [Pseudomonas syringae pv. pisi str. 1704B]
GYSGNKKDRTEAAGLNTFNNAASGRLAQAPDLDVDRI